MQQFAAFLSNQKMAGKQPRPPAPEVVRAADATPTAHPTQTREMVSLSVGMLATPGPGWSPLTDLPVYLNPGCYNPENMIAAFVATDEHATPLAKPRPQSVDLTARANESIPTRPGRLKISIRNNTPTCDRCGQRFTVPGGMTANGCQPDTAYCAVNRHNPLPPGLRRHRCGVYTSPTTPTPTSTPTLATPTPVQYGPALLTSLLATPVAMGHSTHDQHISAPSTLYPARTPLSRRGGIDQSCLTASMGPAASFPMVCSYCVAGHYMDA